MHQPLLIPEYPNDDLVQGDDLAFGPAFWLAHLLLTMGDPDDAPQDYGVTAAAYDSMVERLSDAALPWPVFQIPFGGGHTILVIYASYEDENNVEFIVRHSDWGRLGYLGNIGPSHSGPGLSWQELTTIAAYSPDCDTEPGLSDPAQRLLLLLPMLGDAATPSEVTEVVTHALIQCGISEESAPGFADKLVGREEDQQNTWSAGPDNPIPVCSSRRSARQVPIALGITAEAARALADALTGAAR
ncbi:hypothetical protein ACFQY4_34980 [Catellatospora bangladeshensis]|uniref:hypothetical protein n=1 Tax=Catellatospora bangladeshensis TaxID=310355 RepID=UPI001940AF9F|nr:hypothetical protein [Catellatospora bangladeshensis]